MDPQLLTYYEAIERASADMLNAARAGNWDQVVKLEGACVLLISQLKHAAEERVVARAPDLEEPRSTTFAAQRDQALAFEARAASGTEVMPAHATASDAARAKTRIMQRILVNDAEIRQLAEPWLQTLDEALEGRRRTLH